MATIKYWDTTSQQWLYVSQGAAGGDVVSDLTPQLGGDLESNSNNILMADGDYVQFGNSQMQIWGNTTTIGQGALLFTGTNATMQRSLYFSGAVSIYSHAGATGTGTSAPELSLLESEVVVRAPAVTNAVFSVDMDAGMRLRSNSSYGSLLTDNLTVARSYQFPDADGTLALTSDISSAGYMTASSTNTLTNKTFNTAGTGNVFQINGTTISAITGTGSAVLATSPTLTTPVLGVATATSLNKVTITAPTTSATLTLAQGSTLATSGAFSTTLTATAATNVTLPTTGTLATLAGTETFTNKTLNASSVLFADSTDATKKGQFILSGLTTGITRQYSLPNFNGVLSTVAGTETLTNKTLAAGSNTITGLGVTNLGGITGTPSATTYLRGDGTWGTPAGGGGSSAGFLHNQGSASTTWTVTHGLNDSNPIVEVYSPTNTIIEPQSIVIVNASSLTITFDSAVSGVARVLGTGATDSSILTTVANDPVTPSAGTLSVYAKSIAGRNMLKMKGPSGLDTPLQPAIFQNSLWLVQPNTTTSVSAVGGAVTSTGSISTITPSATTYGLASNFATAATANATAGTGQTVLPLNTSSGVMSNGGFFMVQRLFFPDTEYTTNPIRFFTGVTSTVLATMITSDDHASARMGISILTATETTFKLTTRNTAESRIDTGVTFTPNVLYDFYLFFPPGATDVTWRIDDLTNGVSTVGTSNTQIPAGTTYMRAGFQIATINAVAHNIRMKKIYVETDN